MKENYKIYLSPCMKKREVYHFDGMVDLIKVYGAQIAYITHCWGDSVIGTVSIEQIQEILDQENKKNE